MCILIVNQFKMFCNVSLPYRYIVSIAYHKHMAWQCHFRAPGKSLNLSVVGGKINRTYDCGHFQRHWIIIIYIFVRRTIVTIELLITQMKLEHRLLAHNKHNITLKKMVIPSIFQNFYNISHRWFIRSRMFNGLPMASRHQRIPSLTSRRKSRGNIQCQKSYSLW